jgi:hypothetical protein
MKDELDAVKGKYQSQLEGATTNLERKQILTAKSEELLYKTAEYRHMFDLVSGFNGLTTPQEIKEDLDRETGEAEDSLSEAKGEEYMEETKQNILGVFGLSEEQRNARRQGHDPRESHNHDEGFMPKLYR